MWSVKFMATDVVKGYHVLPSGAKKILADEAEKTKEKEVAALNLRKLTSYNGLMLVQEDLFWFQIIEETKIKKTSLQTQN